MFQLRSAALVALGGSLGALALWASGRHSFPMTVLVGVRLLLWPVLLLALSHDCASLRVPVTMRPMALLGVFAIGLNSLAIVELGASSPKVILVLTQCAADMLLLLVLYRSAGRESPAQRPSSDWLRWSSWVAVAVYGLLFVIAILEVATVPYTAHLRTAVAAGGVLMIPYIIASSLTAKPSPEG